MTDELAALDELQRRLNDLALSLDPASRRAFLRGVGTKIRRTQMSRIAAQKNPDGTAYTPRVRPQKPRMGLRAAHFLYPSGGSGGARKVYMKSWRYDGPRMITGYDIERGAERSFDRSKIIRWLPAPSGQENATAGTVRPASKRQQSMFRKLRGPRFVRLTTTPDEMFVGFSGRASLIGWQHQLGEDRPQRELIGLGPADIDTILSEAYRLVDQAMD